MTYPTNKAFEDGFVEIAYGSNLPPGASGQHAGIGVWFRVNGGEWEMASSRTMHKNVQALECADSVDEFRQYLEII